jgi:seryl-tRNA synthetase
MLNLKEISLERLKSSFEKRGIDINVDLLMKDFNNLKILQQNLEKLYYERNENSKQEIKERGVILKAEIRKLEEEINICKEKLNSTLEFLPNVLNDSVPNNEQGEIVEQNGEIKFFKHHYEMNGISDCEMSGSRFITLKNKFATLERAIANFMIDFVISKGFEEYSLPYILKSKSLYRSCHLPKDQDNMFKINDDFYLIPTSEASLVNLFANHKFESLPYKVTTLSDCFRKEAGSAGKDTKGLIRLHQFKKCEMVVFAKPEESYNILEEMLNISKEILKELKIPYQVRLLGSKDIGFCSAKTYDLEIPIGNQWREVASISNCETFQSMRLNARYDGKLVHTLNGSALAVGRTLASLVEINYNSQLNRIEIPVVLQKRTGFSYIEV